MCQLRKKEMNQLVVKYGNIYMDVFVCVREYRCIHLYILRCLYGEL